jgi:hypothetical protein
MHSSHGSDARKLAPRMHPSSGAERAVDTPIHARPPHGFCPCFKPYVHLCQRTGDCVFGVDNFDAVTVFLCVCMCSLVLH